jgi:23S rRNA (adenine2503-C2)-methyltransferase
MSVDEIFHLISFSGHKYIHAVSISNSIYKHGATSISDLSKIPGKLKSELALANSIGTFKPAGSEVAEDKTVKYLFITGTGKTFETVYIPDNKRNTVCVSTQSGCRMGCSFCVTSKYGFRGNLTAGEIVNQIISIPEAGKITHVVFMGMGEPLDNSESVLKACSIITSEWGLAISKRNVTVSSVGITPGIEKFLHNSECNLALSLFSPFPDEREKLVPAEKLHPVMHIINIMKGFPVKNKRRLSLAYVMINGINDSDLHLEELIKLVKGSEIRVNLLPYNQIMNDLNTSSPGERMQYFKHSLVLSGISASIRKSRGSDISAACGLLASGLKSDVSC